jgi:hypothetical protein
MLIAGSISDIQSARPFFTDDAGTVEKVTFEVETGADVWKDATGAGIVVKHGITERMDMGIGFGHTFLPENERGSSGAELALKFGLIPDLLSLSACGCFGGRHYQAALIFSREFGPVAIDANAGMEAMMDEDDAGLIYAVCCHGNIGRVTLGAEAAGTHRGMDLWQAGGSVEIVDWLAIDAALNGDFDADITLSVTAGLTFLFPVQPGS